MTDATNSRRTHRAASETRSLHFPGLETVVDLQNVDSAAGTGVAAEMAMGYHRIMTVGQGSTRLLNGLERCRVLSGFTPAELAQRAGIARQTLVRWESLKRGASPASIRLLSEALRVMPGLLTETEDFDELVGPGKVVRLMSASADQPPNWRRPLAPTSSRRAARCAKCKGSSRSPRRHASPGQGSARDTAQTRAKAAVLAGYADMHGMRTDQEHRRFPQDSVFSRLERVLCWHASTGSCEVRLYWCW
jgi:transcriptional regulator with XRE-family HTH domain